MFSDFHWIYLLPHIQIKDENNFMIHLLNMPPTCFDFKWEEQPTLRFCNTGSKKGNCFRYERYKWDAKQCNAMQCSIPQYIATYDTVQCIKWIHNAMHIAYCKYKTQWHNTTCMFSWRMHWAIFIICNKLLLKLAGYYTRTTVGKSKTVPLQKKFFEVNFDFSQPAVNKAKQTFIFNYL